MSDPSDAQWQLAEEAVRGEIWTRLPFLSPNLIDELVDEVVVIVREHIEPVIADLRKTVEWWETT
jgi:hypothetical protein